MSEHVVGGGVGTGGAATMRVSSVIVPEPSFAIGTLKSTRMRTRLPARSASSRATTPPANPLPTTTASMSFMFTSLNCVYCTPM